MSVIYTMKKKLCSIATFFKRSTDKVLSWVKYILTLANVNAAEWTVAIRKNSGTLLFEGNNEQFSIIKNSTRYWHADPFLFKHNGKTFLFVEMYDRIKKKGVIGVAKIKNQKCSRFKVCLESEFHLSYPLIYEDNDAIYMIPECCKSGKILLYKAANFPYKWELHEELFQIPGADTTRFVNKNGKVNYLTTIIDSQENDNLWIFNEDNASGKSLISNDAANARMAGNIILRNNKLIRPSQDCSCTYGGAIVFHEITQITLYAEQTIARITIDTKYHNSEKYYSAVINISDSNNRVWHGIHTYNYSTDYEVVDVKYRDGKSIIYFFRNLREYITRKISTSSKQ